MTAEIIELAKQYGRYGYRRITALLRAAGWVEIFTEFPDEDVGTVLMLNIVPRLSRTSGVIRHPAADLGPDTEAVLSEIGYSAEQISELAN